MCVCVFFFLLADPLMAKRSCRRMVLSPVKSRSHAPSLGTPPRPARAFPDIPSAVIGLTIGFLSFTDNCSMRCASTALHSIAQTPAATPAHITAPVTLVGHVAKAFPALVSLCQTGAIEDKPFSEFKSLRKLRLVGPIRDGQRVHCLFSSLTSLEEIVLVQCYMTWRSFSSLPDSIRSFNVRLALIPFFLGFNFFF